VCRINRRYEENTLFSGHILTYIQDKYGGYRKVEYSKEQTEAINSIDGQVCIISVAGSGKNGTDTTDEYG
jgi:hypothetical protein